MVEWVETPPGAELAAFDEEFSGFMEQLEPPEEPSLQNADALRTNIQLAIQDAFAAHAQQMPRELVKLMSDHLPNTEWTKPRMFSFSDLPHNENRITSLGGPCIDDMVWHDNPLSNPDARKVLLSCNVGDGRQIWLVDTVCESTLRAVTEPDDSDSSTGSSATLCYDHRTPGSRMVLISTPTAEKNRYNLRAIDIGTGETICPREFRSGANLVPISFDPMRSGHVLGVVPGSSYSVIRLAPNGNGKLMRKPVLGDAMTAASLDGHSIYIVDVFSFGVTHINVRTGQVSRLFHRFQMPQHDSAMLVGVVVLDQVPKNDGKQGIDGLLPRDRVALAIQHKKCRISLYVLDLATGRINVGIDMGQLSHGFHKMLWHPHKRELLILDQSFVFRIQAPDYFF